MRKVVIVVACCAGMLGMPSAHAAPHGCALGSNDYSLGFDAATRSLVARVNVAAPPAPSNGRDNTSCSFVFAPGDTFSGSGAFKILCRTGGKYNHPDFQGGKYPPIFRVAIPTPCAPGAIVTVDGGHFGTGGGVVAGGIS